MTRTLQRLVLTAALVLGVGGGFGLSSCSTPSVPLPPPAVDTSALRFGNTGAPAGTIVLRGEARFAHQNVRFYFINRTTGDGVITSTAADGSFTSEPLTAAVGDIAEVFFEEKDGDRSETVCVTVLLEQAVFGTGCP